MDNINPLQNTHINLRGLQAAPIQPTLLDAVRTLAETIRAHASNNPPWFIHPAVGGYIVEGAPLTAFEAINCLRGIFGGNNVNGFGVYTQTLQNCEAPVRAIAKEVVSYALSKEIWNQGANFAAYHLLENDADVLTVQNLGQTVHVTKSQAALLMGR